ncbi:1-phosphofructokinase [Staphylococcus argensis]|uniref:Tagatose-6-phosphate kinase n=1 Tax=Staphylococcus argensis TaxID=1607738 RepID=A0A2K4FDL3_9STAP|nr:1-phosphofructokinase [Staphylococcus argensis]MCY6991323.1 1-phosphofructokinase [Staphylococcus argensis]POA09373.1 1-phosphofructokinase [Staphylococcus argensis]
MIYTVTLNPSIDYVVYTEDFQLEGLNRATSTQKFAGGKGINVSRVLQTLNTPTTALGFAGGFSGQFISEQLERQGIEARFIETSEDTRINIKLKTGSETEINAPGPQVTEAQFEALLQQMRETTEQDTVVIAGSMPKSLPRDAYRQIVEILSHTGAQFVVDAEKALVESVLDYHPLFIKPNKDELEMMFDTTIQSDEDVVRCGQHILEKGAQSVIISLGGDGAIYMDAERRLKAQVPTGQVVNTVGSGDSTVAGMVAGLDQGQAIEAAFAQAVAAGTATAFNDDLAEKASIDRIRQQVQITSIDA